MAARAAQFKNQNNDSRSRPLLRARDLEVRSRLRNMNVGVNYKALFRRSSELTADGANVTPRLAPRS